MQMHTVQQLDRGPRTGKFVYAGGNDRMGRHIECCSEAWLEVLEAPAGQRDESPAWERIGHDSSEDAYAHMRAVLLHRLRLDARYGNWAGCKVCDKPTKQGADIPPVYFSAPLCDEHRTRETVERLWDGPGDWAGSY